MRMLSSQRRRHGGPGRSPGPGRGFTSSGPAPVAGATGHGADRPGFTGTAPGWFVDPFVRHEQRYWSGTAWTEHVLDGGTPVARPAAPAPHLTADVPTAVRQDTRTYTLSTISQRPRRPR